jgi:hypothetical protein
MELPSQLSADLLRAEVQRLNTAAENERLHTLTAKQSEFEATATQLARCRQSLYALRNEGNTPKYLHLLEQQSQLKKMHDKLREELRPDYESRLTDKAMATAACQVHTRRQFSASSLS